MIASLGLRLTHAFNADEALKTLRAPDHAEDSGFLLTDLVMPGAMDCVALALKVRAERPGLPLTDLWLRLGLS